MNDEALRGLHDQMRVLKEHWWHAHDEPDPPPYLAVRWKGHHPQALDTGTVAGMIIAAHNRFPNVPLHGITIPADDNPSGAALLVLTLSAIKDGVPLPGGGHGGGDLVRSPGDGAPIDGIIFNIEGWAKVDPEDGTLIQHGDLEREFRTDPASTVSEEMTSYVVEANSIGEAEWWRITSMFHKDDGGVIVWGDPYIDSHEQPKDSESYDGLIDLMCEFVRREQP
jgi:hypothetical protein